ncbi:C6 finger domain protein, partial [Fusarium austroafricanum]
MRSAPRAGDVRDCPLIATTDLGSSGNPPVLTSLVERQRSRSRQNHISCGRVVPAHLANVNIGQPASSCFNGWSTEQVTPGEAESCRANPALWAGVEALMSTSHDCCKISSLSRVGHAISLTSSYIDLPSSLDDPEMCQQIMVVLTQVSLRAGYAWSHLLAQMLSYAEQLLPQVWHLPRDEHSVQTRLLEVLGGLDMDIWILGRRSPPLHIWARYCSGRQGVEEITGLPRPLLDLIAQVSQQGNVMADLEHYLDSLDSSLAQHQVYTWQCFALAALYYQYRHFTPWRDAQSLLDKIAAILCQLHQTMHKSNIRALIWPTDVLLKVSTPDQSKTVLYHDLTPYDLMQQVWKLQATNKEDEIDSILAQQFIDYGLCNIHYIKSYKNFIRLANFQPPKGLLSTPTRGPSAPFLSWNMCLNFSTATSPLSMSKCAATSAGMPRLPWTSPTSLLNVKEAKT